MQKGFNKTVKDYTAALEGLRSGMTIMVGGFGLCGIPEGLIRTIQQLEITDLCCISNNAGIDHFGLGWLLEKKQIRRMISSYIGENALFEKLLLSGEMEVELIPQGTLAERIRAGGAGIPAFYTATGVGTQVAEGKETRTFGNRTYILEKALNADFALIKGWKADTIGNICYRHTAMNFNPMMATAATITVAEVESIVPVGSLDPNQIHTPGIYVHRLLQGTFEKRLEQKTIRQG